jgi:hypothetical protein
VAGFFARRLVAIRLDWQCLVAWEKHLKEAARLMEIKRTLAFNFATLQL